MNPSWRATWCLAWIILTAVVWVGPFAVAEGEDAAWKAERAKLEQVIQTRVEAELDKAVAKRDIVKQLNWRWPVDPPKESAVQVLQRVEKEIEAAAEKKYPAAQRKQFEKEAADKYKIHEKGEEISFTIRGGMGTNTSVSGILYELTPARIRVGSRWIARRDLDEETCANFYEDISQKYQERYVRVENIKYDSKIKVYIADLSRERIPKAFLAAGYVPKRKQYAGSLKPTDWVSQSEVVDFLYAKRREQLEPAIRNRLTEEVFAANGYVLVEDTNKGTREWMPKKEAESFRAKLARLLAEKKQKEEEAKLQAQDPWGEPAAGAPAGEGAEGKPMGEGADPGMMPGPDDQPKQKPAAGQPAANPFEENQ